MLRSSRDNWERLVAAVVKKRQIWELCHRQSFSTSAEEEDDDDLSERTDSFSSTRSDPCSVLSSPPLPPKTKSKPQGLKVALVSIIDGMTWLHFGIKKRSLSKLMENFFRENGGHLLMQQKSLIESGVESTKIYSLKELEKATNKFAEDCVLKRRSDITVYKGILSDRRVVAIKKSRIVDERQIKNFVSEVISFTQIKHKNIVKLLGCCLETEVPLLVYEFISNGTLSEHIHNKGGTGTIWLAWKDRLRIAAEVAGALAYLHSAASVRVVHRDIKSSSILLDNSYSAKLSNFGISVLIPSDQTHVATHVEGTLWYLDPEYMVTGQLNEKCDVYSFGVVLAELVTGKEPFTLSISEETKFLSTYFLKSIEEGRLSQIVDPRISREVNFEQLQLMGDLVKRCLNVVIGEVNFEQLPLMDYLAKRCLNFEGDERPTMKEVAVELDRLIRYTNEAQLAEQSGSPSNFSATHTISEFSS